MGSMIRAKLRPKLTPSLDVSHPEAIRTKIAEESAALLDLRLVISAVRKNGVSRLPLINAGRWAQRVSETP